MRLVIFIVLFVTVSSASGGLIKQSDNENSGINPIEALKDFFTNENDENVEKTEENNIDIENHFVFISDAREGIEDFNIYEFDYLSDLKRKSDFLSLGPNKHYQNPTRDDVIQYLSVFDEEFKSLINECDSPVINNQGKYFLKKSNEYLTYEEESGGYNPNNLKADFKGGNLYVFIEKTKSTKTFQRSIHYLYYVSHHVSCTQRRVTAILFNKNDLNFTEKTSLIDYVSIGNYYTDQNYEALNEITHNNQFVGYLNREGFMSVSDISSNKKDGFIELGLKCKLCDVDFKFKIDAKDFQKNLKERELQEKMQKENDQAENEKIIKDTFFYKLSDEEQKQKTNLLKDVCEELGFKPDTDKFKDCIVELM